MKITIPNVLTMMRIAGIPVFVLAFYLPFAWAHVLAAMIFLLAALTDWLDGYLARKLGQTSRFGAFLDPVADKLLVAVALILLVQAYPSPWLAFPAAVIIGREITISALREWMAESGERARVAVSYIGKVKTAAQMSAIFLLLFHAPIGDFPTAVVGLLLLYVAAALTLWSMMIYLQSAWPSLTDDKNDINRKDNGSGP